MGDIILHSIRVEELKDIIGDIVEAKLRQFRQTEPAKTDNVYITRRDVCNLLKISLATLHSYTKDGTLNGYKIGGRVLYKKDEIERSLIEIQRIKYKHGRN